MEDINSSLGRARGRRLVSRSADEEVKEDGAAGEEDVPCFTFDAVAAFKAHSSVLDGLATRHRREHLRKEEEKAAAKPVVDLNPLSALKETKPAFRTDCHSMDGLGMRLLAAKEQASLRGPYVPPAEDSFRPTEVEKHVGPAWIVDSHLKNNQTLRTETARDQEGFLSGPSVLEVSMREEYDPKTDGKPAFLLQLPHTSGKWHNQMARLKASVDQADMRGEWLGGAAAYCYRDIDRSAKPFVTQFKIASKDEEMASHRRFELLIKTESGAAAEVKLLEGTEEEWRHRMGEETAKRRRRRRREVV